MRALALALLMVAAPTHTSTPTHTPAPTPTPIIIVVIATAPPTIAPRATATPRPTETPVPTATPIPQGQQTDGHYCTGLLNWCPDVGGLVGTVLGAMMSWVSGALQGWFIPGPAVAPPAHATVAAPTSVSTPTPTPRGGPGIPTAPPVDGSQQRQSGRGMVTTILDVATQEQDYTLPSYAPLMNLFAWVMGLTQKIVVALVLFTSLLSFWDGLRRGQIRAWTAFAQRVVLVLLYLGGLTLAAHLWASLLGAIAMGFNQMGMSGYVDTIVGLLAPSVSDTGFGAVGAGLFSQMIGLGLIGVFAVMVIILLGQRLVADMMMALTLALAPLAVASLLVESTRAQGIAWIKTYIAYSLYAPVTAAAIQVIDKLVFSFTSQAAFAQPIERGVLGLIGIGVLLGVPRLCSMVTGGGHSLGEATRALRGATRVGRSLLPL